MIIQNNQVNNDYLFSLKSRLELLYQTSLGFSFSDGSGFYHDNYQWFHTELYFYHRGDGRFLVRIDLLNNDTQGLEYFLAEKIHVSS